jgi:hypothetical protein
VRKYEDAKATAEFFHTSVSALRKWTRVDGLPALQVGRRTVRYNLNEVEQWLKSRQRQNAQKR